MFSLLLTSLLMLASPLFPGPCYCFLAVAVLPAASDVPAPVSSSLDVAALGGIDYVTTLSAVPTIAGIMMLLAQCCY